MNKTITKIRMAEDREDFSWALELTDSERVNLADKLLLELWQMTHKSPFPNLDKSVVRYIRN